MGASNTTRENVNFFSLKAKTSDSDPSPYIGRYEKKEGDEKWSIAELFNCMSGHLQDIKHETYEFEGEKKHKCELHLIDPDGTKNIVSANFSNLLYSLLNALANCTPGNIEFNVWLGKAKMGADGKMGKQYPGIALKNNGEEVKWHYPVTEIPKPTYVKVGEKEIPDDTKVVEFWAKVISNVIYPSLTPFKAGPTNTASNVIEEFDRESKKPISDNKSFFDEGPEHIPIAKEDVPEVRMSAQDKIEAGKKIIAKAKGGKTLNDLGQEIDLLPF